MSTTTIVLIVAVATAIIAALAFSRTGPRVTTIETRREKTDEEKDA